MVFHRCNHYKSRRTCCFNFKMKNPVGSPLIGNKTIDFNVTFTFTLKKDGKPENFEIIGTEIKMY